MIPLGHFRRPVRTLLRNCWVQPKCSDDLYEGPVHGGAKILARGKN